MSKNSCLSGYRLTPDGTEPFPAEYWEDIDPDRVAQVFEWSADNVPDAAWHQAMRIARGTGETAMIELLLRDNPFTE